MRPLGHLDPTHVDGNDVIIENNDTNADILKINGVDISTLTYQKIDGEASYIVDDPLPDGVKCFSLSEDNTLNIFISNPGQAAAIISIKNFTSGDFGLNIDIPSSPVVIPPVTSEVYEVGDGSLLNEDGSAPSNPIYFSATGNDATRSIYADNDVDKSLIYVAKTYYGSTDVSTISINSEGETVRTEHSHSSNS